MPVGNPFSHFACSGPRCGDLHEAQKLTKEVIAKSVPVSIELRGGVGFPPGAVPESCGTEPGKMTRWITLKSRRR